LGKILVNDIQFAKFAKVFPCHLPEFCTIQYNYSISHVPGKSIFTANTLPRAPTSSKNDDSTSLQNETEAFIAAIVSNLPATSDHLDKF